LICWTALGLTLSPTTILARSPSTNTR
jgi:hypothetical protein